MLFTSNFYPPYHLGGYEMLCREVAGRLIARGHRVTVLTSTYGMATNQDREELGVHRRLKLESDVNYYRPQQVLRYWADRRSNRRAVEQLVSKTSPDVVVIWGMWNMSRSIAAWVEQLVGSKVAYYVSNLWPANPSAHEAYWDARDDSRYGSVFKRLLRVPVRLALHKEWRPFNLRWAHVITCSKAVRDDLVQAGVPIEHAEVIYHGIDPIPYRRAREQREQNPPDDVLRAVYVGGLVPHKGVHTAIEAMGHLTGGETPIPVSLDILGAGHPQYGLHLHQLVRDLELADVVSFHRPISRSELPGFLAGFDVLVMPSVWEEPQARISQEAMAAGLVLVATPTGGTKEILVHGENGLAFQPEDAEGLALHLRRVAENMDLRHRLTRAGWRTVAERFTISRMVDQLETYLANVAAG
jgi:glycosyltransferase involved in cell wall biosynthesis